MIQGFFESVWHLALALYKHLNSFFRDFELTVSQTFIFSVMIKLFQLEVKGNFFQIFKISLPIVSALIRVNCILIDLNNPIMFMHFLDIHQRDPLFCHSVDQENLGQETVHRYEKRKVVIVEVDDKLDIPTIFILFKIT